jgi:uncharacterized protein (TIGR03067 family)
MVATLALALVAGVVSADDATEKDLKAMQGKWSVASAVDRGKPVPAKELEGMEIEFKGATMITREGKSEEKNGVKLDPSKKPKVMLTDPVNGEKPAPAIYEIDGDTLKIAFAKGGTKPPASFDLKKGDDVQIFVLKRKK